jgi:hypothetical protein
MPTQTPEVFKDLMFPIRGLDRADGFGQQREGTTPTGNNVRGYEPLTKRLRGGARPGLARYVNHAPAAEWQELNLVVLPSGTALGISFDDVAILDLTFQLTDPSGARALLADGTTGWVYVGGSGYHTPNTYVRTAKPSITSLVPDFGGPSGGTVVTVVGENLGDTINSTFKFDTTEATILSNDGTTAVITSPAHAIGTINVTCETDAGTSETGAQTEYDYGYIQFRQAKADGAVTQITFDSDVRSGSMIFLIISTFGAGSPTVTVSDNQLNTYTQVASYTYRFGTDEGISCWRTFTSAAGALTISVSPSSAATMSMVGGEYANVATVGPVDGTGGGNIVVSGTSWSTNNIGVSGSNEAIVAGFAQQVQSGTVTLTGTGGYTVRASFTNGNLAQTVYLMDKLDVSATEAATGTLSVSGIDGLFIGASLVWSGA